MSGPCLCGDVYCSSCGDPGAAAFADFVEEAGERFEAVLGAAMPDGDPIEPIEARERAVVALGEFLEAHGEWIVAEWNRGTADPYSDPAAALRAKFRQLRTAVGSYDDHELRDLVTTIADEALGED